VVLLLLPVAADQRRRQEKVWSLHPVRRNKDRLLPVVADHLPAADIVAVAVHMNIRLAVVHKNPDFVDPRKKNECDWMMMSLCPIF